jgi:hypothetical protein
MPSFGTSTPRPATNQEGTIRHQLIASPRDPLTPPTPLESDAAFWRQVAADPTASALRHLESPASLSEKRIAYVIAVQNAVLTSPAYVPYTTKTGRGRTFCNLAFSEQATWLGVRGASVLGIRSANAQVRRLTERAERGRGWFTLTDKPFMQELANHGIFVGAGRIETVPDECGELHGHVAMVRCGPDSWVCNPDAPFINNVGTRNVVVPHARAHRDFTWFTPDYDPTARIMLAEAAVQLGAGFQGELSPAAEWIGNLLKTAAAETGAEARGAIGDRARVAQHYAAGLLRDLTKSRHMLEPSWLTDACRSLFARSRRPAATSDAFPAAMRTGAAQSRRAGRTVSEKSWSSSPT